MNEQARHEARLSPYVAPHLARRQAGQKHPIHDFLFQYYSFRPAQLMRWRPPGRLDTKTRPIAETTLRLLKATMAREGNFSCFGLHEWAMVYRDPATRHPQPLRLGNEGTDEVVEAHRVRCSHWDAVRFFTPPALPLNTLKPRAHDRPAFEQPACLHGNMDLYKHAYRLADVVGADLVADAFELAWDVRIVDMRAAPYDMSGITIDPYGIAWTPIRIETAEGKRVYADLQRQFADRAAPLRQRLVEAIERSLSCAAEGPAARSSENTSGPVD
ncbi:3-methyladenine DNA glycosylase [Nocardioides daejeonensis]|uniref:3-methyladenine DNA glycosylase n=1 Tax=Nocardioides daejeonensis TaxID=1046556 RepID=UPI000D740D2B|nr:3-methyladenine DNA glycosylase [Nocardioides daejeonensis]